MYFIFHFLLILFFFLFFTTFTFTLYFSSSIISLISLLFLPYLFPISLLSALTILLSSSFPLLFPLIFFSISSFTFYFPYISQFFNICSINIFITKLPSHIFTSFILHGDFSLIVNVYFFFSVSSPSVLSSLFFRFSKFPIFALLFFLIFLKMHFISSIFYSISSRFLLIFTQSPFLFLPPLSYTFILTFVAYFIYF